MPSSAPLSDAQLLGREPVGAERCARELDQLGQRRLARRRAARGSACRAQRVASGRAAAPDRGCRARGRARPAGSGSGARAAPIGGRSPTRVPRRGSLTTTPRRRSSARPAATVDRAEPDLGREPPDRRQPLAGGEPPARRRAASTLGDELGRARAPMILYCIGSVIDLYYYRFHGGIAWLSTRRRARRAARPASDRVRLRRKRERGSYERAAIDAILDEALIAHLGHRRRARPAARDPDAARPRRRRRLLPRLDRQPHAAGDGRAARPSA